MVEREVPKLSVADNSLSQSCDVIIVGYDGSSELIGTAAELDRRLHGSISALIKSEKMASDRGETMLVPIPSSESDSPDEPMLSLWVAVGEQEKRDRGAAFQLASTSIRAIIGTAYKSVVSALAESFEADDQDMIVAGTLAGLEGQAIYRTKSPVKVLGAIAFVGISAAALQRGQVLAESINLTKRLVNEPASVVFPDSFAEVAKEVASKHSIECEVWDEKKLEQENCRAILAVGAGSEKPPRLVILKYNGGPADQPPLAVVGKGVTFDSGGLSLKSSEGMVDMKCDMAGAATVLGVMQAVAQLGIPRNVIGLCGLAENMVSGSSYKLGDVIETRSGKRIEILNTDAEGRVVLADTLDVAIGLNPSAMVDLATLTGACLVALGKEVAGVMTNDQAHCDAVMQSAKLEGEWVWQLPMFEFYDEKVKSKVADIKNVGEARWGGAITAAKFLENFVGEVPWVHLDIAGPAFADSPKPYRDAGGTGAMVRTLVRWIEAN